MKNLKKYLGLIFLGALSLTSCQDSVDAPEMADNKATWLDNANYEEMSIADVKAAYWSDDTNYYMPIGKSKSGKNIIVRGRVISSDAAGNVYKSLVIQDATGALAVSINASSMNTNLRRGQELVLNLTGTTIGKYAGLQQLGFPEDSPQYGKQTTFMPYAFFLEHMQLNGQPDLAKVDTILVNSLSELSGGPEVIRKWQSQLVRFNNCSFEEGGKATFAASKVSTRRNLKLSDGSSIVVNTSGYANFYSAVLPEGNGDVVGLLGYFNNAWQVTLIDLAGCMNFGNPTIGPGAESNPYTVDQAVSIVANGGSITSAWTQGVIVGAVAPGVTTTVSKNKDIQWGKNVELPTTLVIAQSADVKDYTKCIVIKLPQGSKLRQFGNLVDNPANLGKTIKLLGNVVSDMGITGITGNNGTTSEFSIEGVEIPATTSPDFNTFNGGAATQYYGTYTSATGWTAENALILQGGAADANPVFTIFGDASSFAVCLNGKTTAVGKLISPTLTGGIGTLTFDYCLPFSDTKCGFTVNIKQGGNVVASDVVTNDSMAKLTKYSYSHAFNVKGDFVLEIVNNCPSAATANKDRVALWNMSWTH